VLHEASFQLPGALIPAVACALSKDTCPIAFIAGNNYILFAVIHRNPLRSRALLGVAEVFLAIPVVAI